MRAANRTGRWCVQRDPARRDREVVRLRYEEDLLRREIVGDPPDHFAHARLDDLQRMFPGIEWKVELGESEILDPQARIAELVRGARTQLLDHGWDLLVYLTDIPMISGGRPVAAHASPIDGVGLVSVPALGVVDVDARVREAVIDVLEALVPGSEDGDRREELEARFEELASAVGTAQVRDDDTIRFTNAVIRGHLRLLVGMVRANRPWRVAAKLSRALVASLGTAAYVLASAGFWTLAAHMTWPRLLGLTLAAIVITSVALIVAHDLWERGTRPETRERVVLFNLVTTLTIAIGVLTLYLALLAFSMIGSVSLIPQDALEEQLGHSAGPSEYLRLAWLATSLASLAGALGSLVESDLAVREAAYGHRPQNTQEKQS